MKKLWFIFLKIIFIYLPIFFLPILSYTAVPDIKEEIFWLDIPSVITSAKREQKVTESPTAISVVTAEDLKLSGATLLFEGLRMVVGTHFGYTASNCMNAGGIRGLNKIPPNKIIFMIDGVPFMFENYGVPADYILPISLDEIDRIEIMKGPGSSLYGANAMLGVINVITKRNKGNKGNFLSVVGGEFNTLNSDFIHYGVAGEKVDYRVSIGGVNRDGWDYIAYADNPTLRLYRFNTDIDYHFSGNSKINFSASYINGPHSYFLIETKGPVDYRDGLVYFMKMSFESKSPDIVVKAAWKKIDYEWSGFLLGEKDYGFISGTHDFEFQHIIEVVKDKDKLLWGANYLQSFEIARGVERKSDLYGLFFDNTYFLLDKVQIFTGARFDRHSYAGDTLSPRVSLVYFPVENNRVRLTYGSSYRNPDFIESYYEKTSVYRTNYPYPGWTTYIRVYGQEDNKPEKAETIECSYLANMKRFSLEANIFYTTIKDFVYFISMGQVVSPVDKSVTIQMPFTNIGDAIQRGGEVELRYNFTSWLSWVINYTYLEQEEIQSQVKQLLVMTPKNMANTQLRAKFRNGITTNLSLHYRDSSEWRLYTWYNPVIPPEEGPTVAGGKSDAYWFATLYLGYNFNLFKGEAEVGLSAFNLTDNRFDEYPIDTQDIKRRVTISFRYKF